MSFPPAPRDRVMVRTSTGAGKNTEKSDGPVRHLARRPNGLVAENVIVPSARGIVQPIPEFGARR